MVYKILLEKERVVPQLCQYWVSKEDQLKYFYHELEFAEYKAYYEHTDRNSWLKIKIEHEYDPDASYDGLMFISNWASGLRSTFDKGNWFESKFRKEMFTRVCSYDKVESCKSDTYTLTMFKHIITGPSLLQTYGSTEHGPEKLYQFEFWSLSWSSSEPTYARDNSPNVDDMWIKINMQQMRLSKAIYYDQLSLLAEMGGTYTSILGIMATFYIMLFKGHFYRLAHLKYSVAGSTDVEDRTSNYEEATALQLAVEKIINPNACVQEENYVKTRSLKDDMKKLRNSFKQKTPEEKAEEEAEEEAEKIMMSDFSKNVGYFGSLDHYYQLEMENETLKKVVIKLNEGLTEYQHELTELKKKRAAKKEGILSYQTECDIDFSRNSFELSFLNGNYNTERNPGKDQHS